MDKSTKIMSSEYDMIYVQEATELTEEDWESLTTRLRNGIMPYQQLMADCNPSHPQHWLKLRCDRGATLLLESRHEDNPSITPAYIAKLDALTGVMKLRLRYGRWAAAEGMVYESWIQGYTKSH
jgi:phage terminase large subunit